MSAPVIVSQAVLAALDAAIAAAEAHQNAANELEAAVADLWRVLSDFQAVADLGLWVHIARGLVTCSCARSQDLACIIETIAETTRGRR